MSTYASSVHTDMSALPRAYEALLSRASETSLFFSLPWYQNLARWILAPDQRPRIYAVDGPANAEVTRAMLFMYHDRSRPGLVGRNTLRGLSNYYTSLFGPLLHPGEPDLQNVLDALAAAMINDEIRWDAIDLHPLASEAPVFPALLSALGRAGLIAQSYFCFGNWYLRVSGRSYAEYFGTLPSQVQNTVKRKKKQLEKANRLKIVVYRDEQGLEEALRAYDQIYAVSWKVPEPYPDFVPGLCRFCARLGWLRLGVAYVDSLPVAAQIWIVNAGIAAIYKLAYDERFAKVSAGSILTAHLMEHVIDVDKVHEVDYLTGDDPYKRDWMSDRRERWGIVAFNPRTPHGLLAAGRHFAGRAARRMADAMRGQRRA